MTLGAGERMIQPTDDTVTEKKPCEVNNSSHIEVFGFVSENDLQGLDKT